MVYPQKITSDCKFDSEQFDAIGDGLVRLAAVLERQNEKLENIDKTLKVINETALAAAVGKDQIPLKSHHIIVAALIVALLGTQALKTFVG